MNKEERGEVVESGGAARTWWPIRDTQQRRVGRVEAGAGAQLCFRAGTRLSEMEGNAEAQAAVYGNRRRIRGDHGKVLLCGDGASCWRKVSPTRMKRSDAHVRAFNLALVMRQLIGIGTPRGA